MSSRLRTRTCAVTATAALCLLAVSPPGAVAHDGDDTSHGPARTHGHTAKLAELREATSAYRDGPAAPWTIEVADLAQITCIEDPHGAGTMGIHYLNGASLGDGTVERLAPEALIYEPHEDGSMTLIAAEYLVLAADWDAEHAAPPILYGQRFQRVAAGNRYGLPDFYELHVWHERANSNGTFNDWNPAVQCVEPS